MPSIWTWNLRKFFRQIWVRISLFGLVGVITALLAAFLPPLLPDTLAERLGSSAAETVLNILASSMLTV
ncbi:MAG: hypothetical protein Q7J57_03700, partial [Gemmobacter sp.]|nr:hypothetical protein [Gemmobacter sp.]